MALKRLLKIIAVTILPAVILLGAHGVMAETVPLAAPFIGSFETLKYIRALPKTDSDNLIAVPAGSSLYLTPVNEKYAQTAYENVEGFIFYQDAVPRNDLDEPLSPYAAYATRAEYAYSEPHFSGKAITAYPAHTPFLVTATNGTFARIQTPDGEKQYLPSRALTPLKADTPQTPYHTHIGSATVLFGHPLAGAEAIAVLPMGALAKVTARNGDYARVTVNSLEGYVLFKHLEAPSAARTATLFAYVPLATVTYQAPSQHDYTDEIIPAGTILEIDGVSGAFSHIKHMACYVLTDSIKKLATNTLSPTQGYWEADQPLYLNTTGKLVPLNITLPANTLIEIRVSYGNYYCVYHQGQWGFVPKNGVKTLSTNSYRTPLALIAPEGAMLKTRPMNGADPLGAPLETATPLWVSKTINGYAPITVDGAERYIAYEHLVPTSPFKDVRTYEAYVEKAADILSFPHESGDKIGTVEANALLTIARQNDDYAYIRHGLVKGYIALKDLRKMSALFDGGKPDQNYYLFLNKATRELTVYLADADGNKTDTVARSVIVAIGKQTTPTPSGTFALGQRERWHYFGPSFVPYAIKYAQGRYLHGPLYHSSNEASVNKAHLSDFGKAVTGGCIRIPYDDMLWIYCHCMESNATLEIVNGV